MVLGLWPKPVGAQCQRYNWRHIRNQMSGRSVFYKNDNGEIFNTYSSYGRGGEDHLGAYRLLDIVPNGRTETINGNLTDWVRHHDRYEATAKAER